MKRECDAERRARKKDGAAIEVGLSLEADQTVGTRADTEIPETHTEAGISLVAEGRGMMISEIAVSGTATDTTGTGETESAIRGTQRTTRSPPMFLLNPRRVRTPPPLVRTGGEAGHRIAGGVRLAEDLGHLAAAPAPRADVPARHAADRGHRVTRARRRYESEATLIETPWVMI